MDKKERVFAAIAHREADRVPKGETWIAGELCNQILGSDFPLDYQHFERDLLTRQKLNMDLVNIGDWPQEQIGYDDKERPVYLSNYGYEFIVEKNKKITRMPLEDIEDAASYQKPDIGKVDPSLIKRFAAESDLFVFAQIGGPVSMLNEMFDMEDFMVHALTNTKEMVLIAEKVMEYEIEKAKLFIDNGADGIFFADDIAFNSGLFLPPYIMDELVFPFYGHTVKTIKNYKDLPVFAHSDGNINSVLERYIDFGFDGLQSLQPSAGMDLADVKRRVGDRLCLWGNIDLNYTMSFGAPGEVGQAVKEAIRIGNQGGGFILSTCNSMIESIPTENVFAMMRASEAF